jgi:hypothetical protein
LKLRALPSTQHKAEFIQFAGGLDTVSTPISIPPGFVRDSQNFEEDIYGGYASIAGYERFDGRPSPSSALFSVLNYTVAGTVAVGNTITGATSGATGLVIAITATSFILTKTVGTFVTEATTALGASVVGAAVISGEYGRLGAYYNSLAANAYRADIAAVPGSGSVLGVWQYKGTVYAFRNNAGATAVGMYKSSAAGWVAVPLGIEVYFSGGSGTAPAEGATITQGAVSGVLSRLIIESGTFGASTAAGRLIFSTVTAGPFTAAAFTAGITATCVSQATITIPNVGGRFSFVNANFYGQSDRLRMYGCDGANRAFEFDGTTFIPLNTGLGSNDKPTHIIEHNHLLFLSFESALLNSAIGNPYNWQTTLGAGEIDVSDKITGLMGQPGSNSTPALAIYCRNSTYMLYGTGATSWNLVKYNDNGGAIPWSIQKIGQTYVMDDRGITTLQTTQAFSNFAESTISKRVHSWFKTKRTQVSDSHISRDKQQYKLFFSDGSAAYWTIGDQSSSMMPVFLPNKVLCSSSEETYGGGDELIYFGSDNGFVYQMDRGTSFDGGVIDCHISMAFNNLNSYRMLKKYRRITFEMVGSGYSEFSSTYDLGYGSTELAQPDASNHTVNLATPYWDSFTWDNFIWDGTPLTTLSMSTPGNGENIAIKIMSSSNYFYPVKFSGALIEYSPLRTMR